MVGKEWESERNNPKYLGRVGASRRGPAKRGGGEIKRHTRIITQVANQPQTPARRRVLVKLVDEVLEEGHAAVVVRVDRPQHLAHVEHRQRLVQRLQELVCRVKDVSRRW